MCHSANLLKMLCVFVGLTICGCQHDTLGQQDVKNPIVITPKDSQHRNNLALFQAVQGNSIEEVTALLDKGADPNFTRPYGNSYRTTKNEKLISEKTEQMTVLMSACAWGESQTVELLIRRGADINAQDNVGNTALIWAATAEKGDTVAVLLKHQAKVNVKDEMGMTALDMAAGHPQIVAMLQKAGGKSGREITP